MRLLDIALYQVGKSDNGNNNIEYNTWYYGREVDGGSFPWCAVFVSWCAAFLDIPTSVVPKTASVKSYQNFYEKQGLLHKNKDYKPKSGDIFIQRGNGISHLGVVISSNSSGFYSVEGGVDGKVVTLFHDKSDKSLVGFASPNYSKEHREPLRPKPVAVTGTSFRSAGYTLLDKGFWDNFAKEAEKKAKEMMGDLQKEVEKEKKQNEKGQKTEVKNASGVGRYTYTTYTVKEGDTLESIADAFNVAPQMIYFANNLEKWEVSAGQTLHIPQAKGILSKSDATSGVGAIETPQHTVSVTVSHPTIEIHFYGEYGKLSAMSYDSTTSNTQVDNDIISTNTVRNMGQDCPTFSINLVWKNKWYKNLASNDMIVIYMQRPPESKRIIMFGLIDDIRKVTDYSGTQPQRAVQVTGRGFNKCFVQFDIGLIENYSTLDLGTGFFTTLTSLAKCSSKDAIELVIKAYLGKGMNYHFGDGKSLKDHFVYKGEEHKGEKLMDYSSFTSFHGSLWNFIKELSNQPFNETFWEVIDDKPTMIHRPTPFNKEPWINLNRILIKDDEIVSNNTGRSDIETYTVYNVHMSLLGEETRNIFPPYWYPPYYAKYGLRELAVSTLFEVNGSGYETREFTKDLFNFNIKNNLFENGQITVKGSSQYKVGERVILESENMEFYVESVTQSFNMYNNWTTTLGVTRGMEPEKRFLPPFGAAEDLTPTVMWALIKQTGDEKIEWYNLKERKFSSRNVRRGGKGGAAGGAYDFRGLTFVWPVPSVPVGEVSSPYGWRTHPVTGEQRFHHGIDISDDYGATIVAACDGEVISSGEADGYGHWIRIDHGSGIVTIYGHEYADGLLCNVGDNVKAGDKIGLIGSDGWSTGPHCHFQVEIDGEDIDPMACFAQRKPSSVSGVGADASTAEVISAVYSFCTNDLGLNKCAACAVLGNMEQESTLSPVAENKGNGALGLIQWLDRRDALERFCRENGYDVLSVEGQLMFMKYEFETTESRGYNILVNATNSRDAVFDTAVNFGEAYERYGAGEEGDRGKFAVDHWDSL